MKKIITKSEKETFELGKNFSEKLKGGEVIGLIGELGAGKTVFTKGLGKGLKIKEVISSPTFVLMKIYKTKNKNIKSLIHIDAYRLQSEKDLEIIGID
jgi:tRNA threonylcarbamoyladenosine biosynthesis protein TsaE